MASTNAHSAEQSIVTTMIIAHSIGRTLSVPLSPMRLQAIQLSVLNSYLLAMFMKKVKSGLRRHHHRQHQGIGSQWPQGISSQLQPAHSLRGGAGRRHVVCRKAR